MARRKRRFEWLITRALPLLAWTLLRSLGATWRWRIAGRHNLLRARAAGKPIFCSMLHGRLLPLIYLGGLPDWRPFLVLVSSSRDGEIIRRTSNMFGIDSVSGSSGKEGARAFRQVREAAQAKTERAIAIFVDGGRGPRGHCKAGAVQLASRSGGIILPVVLSAGPCWIARSWDRMIIPKPFAKLSLYIAPPVHLERMTPEHVERVRARLENFLVKGTTLADLRAYLGDKEPVRVP